jgi:hypothetical protein
MRQRVQRVIQAASAMLTSVRATRTPIAADGSEATMQGYARPGELDPAPPGMASLYRVPWRAHARTVSARDALQGIGVYWKHIPLDWTLEEQTNVMRQMFAAGVKRLRLAPHHAIYITKDWVSPQPLELETLRKELRASKAAGIRPCVVFVHIPPIGKPGTRELQDWWRQGELMPAGEVGSAEFTAYLDKTYDALRVILNQARAAGFTEASSYDLELGQNLWWGAPATPRPLPNTDITALEPGGRIYEFDRALITRLREQGYAEPALWWGQVHHQFEAISDEDLPDACAGWAVSIYGGWTGKTATTWLTGGPSDRDRGPNDVWPVRAPLRFLEGKAPRLVLARPESYLGDRTRHDNLIEFIARSRKPVAITSLGTVPNDIPAAAAGRLDGWQIKQRGLTRSLAFWLNQGSHFVLLHSAYEAGQRDDGAGAHSLLPTSIDPGTFTIERSRPLATLRSFAQALEGATPIEKPAELTFHFALVPDPVLIPASGTSGSLRASDAIALLPFQIDGRTFAVAAYVVSPNIAQPMDAIVATVQIDRRIAGPVSTMRPATQQRGTAAVEQCSDATVVRFALHDDVTWLRFAVE